MNFNDTVFSTGYNDTGEKDNSIRDHVLIDEVGFPVSVFENESFVGNVSGTTDWLANLNLPFQDSTSKGILVALFVIIAFFCIVGNLMALFVFTRKSTSSRTYLFLANLAVADLLVGIFCVIPAMYKFFSGKWYFGEILCRAFKFVEQMNLTASVLFLEVIAIERYIVINHALKARQFFTKRNMYIAQALLWLISAVYNSHFLFTYHVYSQPWGRYCIYRGPFLKLTKIYKVMNFVVWFVHPLVVISILYFKISRKLWKSRMQYQMVAVRKRVTSLGSSNLSEDLQENGNLRPALHDTANGSVREYGDQKNMHQSSTNDRCFRACPLVGKRGNASQRAQTTEKKAKLCSARYGKTVSAESEVEDSKYLEHDKNIQVNGTARNLLTEDEVLSTIPSTPKPGNKAEKRPKSLAVTSYRFRPSLSSLPPENTELSRVSPSLLDHSDTSDSSTCKSIEEDPFPGSDSFTFHLRENAGNRHHSHQNVNHDNHHHCHINKNNHHHHHRGFKYPQRQQQHQKHTSPISSIGHYATNYCSHYNTRCRVIRLLIVVLSVFVLLVFPFHINEVRIVARFHIGGGGDFLFTFIAHALVYMNSAINPVIYSLLSKKFRRSLVQSINVRHLIQRCRWPRPRARMDRT